MNYYVSYLVSTYFAILLLRKPLVKNRRSL